MRKGIEVLRKGITYIVALVLVAGYPLSAMADTQEPVTEQTSTTPTTTETAPPPEEPKLTYTYDPSTEKWNSEKWVYNPETGAYETPPAPTIIEPPVTGSAETTTDKTVDTTVDVGTDLNSNATSGDSTVSGNTQAGSATTGDAEALANIINVVNSTITTGDNQKVATFTQDILGDVKGDIVLYPMLLKAMLEASVNEDAATTINATTDLGINNNINLAAQSGDATVSTNTAAGDATTGTATAVANVVNILNSMIAAQDSFIGTINIYGNLEGDILIAPDFIPQMLANNSTSSSDLTVSQEDTTTIVNNIAAVAESGAASVLGNTEAGSATTGDALSNVVIFNVTGHEIIAKNSLLVFVNVLGKWVGMIVDAPEGATAAMLGNGVTTNTTYAPDLTVNSQSTHGITNTIAVNAQSGDALVAHNTSAGNAVSGQAMAMANVANVAGNQFGLSDWFGVLFINVFQNWYGSFGINTPYGDPVKTEATPAPTGPIQFIPAETKAAPQKVRMMIVDSRTSGSESAAETSNTSVVLANTDSVIDTSDLLKDEQKPAPTESYDYRLWIIAGSLFVIGLSAIGLRRLILHQ